MGCGHGEASPRAAPACRFHGGTFPYGVEYTQSVVGANPDGKWGPASSARHDETVKAVQRALAAKGLYGGNIDGIWGQGTENGYVAAWDVRFRR